MFKLTLIFFSLAVVGTFGNVSVHNPFYCYAQDRIRQQLGMFSIYSAYETHRGDSVDPSASSCTPSKFWFMNRHGTRLQSRSEIQNIYDHSERVRSGILSSYAAGRSSLCESDVALIRNWTVPDIPLEREQALTDAGWAELEGLAQRYQRAFPGVLPSTYARNDFYFRSTSTQRAIESLRAFTVGLFGASQTVVFEPIVNPDLLLRAHDFCDAFIAVSGTNEEQEAFADGPEYQEMLTQVSNKLGFFGANHLTRVEVETLLNLCRFEQIWDINSTSPFCSAFSIANHQVLEYYEDLHWYYRCGYGNIREHRVLYESVNCNLFQDLLRFLASDDPNDFRAKVYSGHTATIQLLLTTFNMFRDSETLTRHTFAQHVLRQWRMSKISMKASNLAVVRYE